MSKCFQKKIKKKVWDSLTQPKARLPGVMSPKTSPTAKNAVPNSFISGGAAASSVPDAVPTSPGRDQPNLKDLQKEQNEPEKPIVEQDIVEILSVSDRRPSLASQISDDTALPPAEPLTPPTLLPASSETKTEKPASSSAAAAAPKKKKRKGRIQVYLETKYESIQAEVEARGWRVVNNIDADWDLYWTDTSMNADKFIKMKPYQKTNHFVGMCAISRKNNLGRNLLRMRKNFPKEFKFFPDTWILPTDITDFKAQFTGKRNKTFIIKPDNG